MNKTQLPQSSTNLKNRVNKLHLPKTKPLYPLFEIISNSIHSIDERKTKENGQYKGKILVQPIRNGKIETLESLDNIDIYPINSFSIIDNGIGLDNDNFISFREFDSEKKSKIGGKGVGRLVCLKAFSKIVVKSVYVDNQQFRLRKFDYKKTKDGFENYDDAPAPNKKSSGTNIILSKLENEYLRHLPIELFEIARQIVNHFQLYFIQKIEPIIILRNQNKIEVNLTNLFNAEFEKEILSSEFNVGENVFKVYISKSFKAKSHKIYYCAHQRIVKDEGLSKFIEDLRYLIVDEKNPNGYYYQIFVVSDFLNSNVNEERTNFNFSTEEDEEEDTEDITLSKIRKLTVIAIEELLLDFLQKARKEKLDTYNPIIEKEFPNYHAVINYNKEKVEKLPVGLSKHELDLKLYEIESEWRIKVKNEGLELLDKKKDITTLDEYKALYSKFLEEFNIIGQSDLARYVIHRRSVIDLLDKLIKLNGEDKFSNEDLVHSLFFPIRETNSTVANDKQNLWLLDERLTFNSLLASDKLFKQIPAIGSDSSDRMDLVIRKEEVFENATLYSEYKYPFESFTIVEFKKPERDNYSHGDREKDPVKQVRMYIEEIISGKTKVFGKTIEASITTPFYCYIIADITPSLKKILEYESFDPTPDGLGYFRFFVTTASRAYIEVLPFQKVVKDAKQRNKILFDKMLLI